MPSGRERIPLERETLMFSNREQAEAFKHEVGEQVRRQNQAKGIGKRREKVAEAVAEEFARAGEAVGTIKRPWEHTPAEHEEAQALVNVAFARDLGAALRQARSSPNYPRNLDLFHDVLTGEMYDLVVESKINKQPLAGWALVIAGVAAGVLLAVLAILAG